MKNLDVMIQQLPLQIRKEISDFSDFLLKQERHNTSPEFQKKALEWRGIENDPPEAKIARRHSSGMDAFCPCQNSLINNYSQKHT